MRACRNNNQTKYNPPTNRVSTPTGRIESGIMCCAKTSELNITNEPTIAVGAKLEDEFVNRCVICGETSATKATGPITAVAEAVNPTAIKIKKKRFFSKLTPWDFATSRPNSISRREWFNIPAKINKIITAVIAGTTVDQLTPFNEPTAQAPAVKAISSYVTESGYTLSVFDETSNQFKNRNNLTTSGIKVEDLMELLKKDK